MKRLFILIVFFVSISLCFAQVPTPVADINFPAIFGKLSELGINTYQSVYNVIQQVQLMGQMYNTMENMYKSYSQKFQQLIQNGAFTSGNFVDNMLNVFTFTRDFIEDSIGYTRPVVDKFTYTLNAPIHLFGVNVPLSDVLFNPEAVKALYDNYKDFLLEDDSNGYYTGRLLKNLGFNNLKLLSEDLGFLDRNPASYVSLFQQKQNETVLQISNRLSETLSKQFAQNADFNINDGFIGIGAMLLDLGGLFNAQYSALNMLNGQFAVQLQNERENLLQQQTDEYEELKRLLDEVEDINMCTDVTIPAVF